jgi:hypothetical protein
LYVFHVLLNGCCAGLAVFDTLTAHQLTHKTSEPFFSLLLTLSDDLLSSPFTRCSIIHHHDNTPFQYHSIQTPKRKKVFCAGGAGLGPSACVILVKP